ncbi:HD-GYP domain-containing protein [Sporomusa sp. KB1]|jgi:putative nucleotidyltransferase with HDIG domain|uniref:HD-GYP domain-containing protein n=1 Tax=Sporomusa sp. KB1 TaxID=943346 RepID=UPI001C94EBD9|nr:HD-GYP domain-containing protein [Sporomusa sp. KB1]
MFPKYDKTLDIISSTFKKVRKFDEVPIAECKELAENYIELMIDIEGVLDNLYRLQTHHEHTFTHSLHVAILTGLLGKWTGFTGTMLKNFILSGLLHDIGKVLVPREILDKPGPLTTEETDIIKLHSEQGYHLLSTCYDVSEEVKLGVLQHHEREDGSGYPFGLKEKDLNICAKFVAIADTYDAMTSDRAYRKKIPPFIAINLMLNQMYGKLDSVICSTLSAKLQNYSINKIKQQEE